jgi:hypothetical protein
MLEPTNAMCRQLQVALICNLCSPLRSSHLPVFHTDGRALSSQTSRLYLPVLSLRTKQEFYIPYKRWLASATL